MPFLSLRLTSAPECGVAEQNLLDEMHRFVAGVENAFELRILDGREYVFERRTWLKAN